MAEKPRNRGTMTQGWALLLANAKAGTAKLWAAGRDNSTPGIVQIDNCLLAVPGNSFLPHLMFVDIEVHLRARGYDDDCVQLRRVVRRMSCLVVGYETEKHEERRNRIGQDD